jgi:hypothetical protein
MPNVTKILYIDSDYQTMYFIFRPRIVIRTSVPLETALQLLKTEEFNLIISEPHNKAILKNEDQFLKFGPVRSDFKPS